MTYLTSQAWIDIVSANGEHSLRLARKGHFFKKMEGLIGLESNLGMTSKG